VWFTIETPGKNNLKWHFDQDQSKTYDQQRNPLKHKTTSPTRNLQKVFCGLSHKLIPLSAKTWTHGHGYGLSRIRVQIGPETPGFPATIPG